MIPWPTPAKRRGRPYVYPPLVMLRCFIVRLWMRLPSNNALHAFLSIDCPYNARIARACGLGGRLPDRRTFDRRFRTVSSDVGTRIDSMGRLFVDERLVDPYVVCVDSTIMEARRGLQWHVKDMKENRIPYTGIDTEARWGKLRRCRSILGHSCQL